MKEDLYIIDSYSEWKTILQNLNVNNLYKLVFPDSLKECDYFMTSPLSYIGGEKIEAVSRKFTTLDELNDFVLKNEIIPFLVYETKDADIVMRCFISEK